MEFDNVCNVQNTFPIKPPIGIRNNPFNKINVRQIWLEIKI